MAPDPKGKIQPFNLRFLHGSTFLLAGASGSGKTHTLASILKLKDKIIQGGNKIQNVVFCYAAWQPIYTELQTTGIVTTWINKMPTNSEFIEYVQPYQHKGGSIVCIDDFMSELSKDLVEIVTVSSRHYNTSTFILFQNLFPISPLARQISLNVKYMIIFRNPRENQQISYLLRQIRPHGYKWIQEAYHEATKEPFSCFLIDLTQQCNDNLRFRSNFLPHQFPIKVWIQNKTNV